MSIVFTIDDNPVISMVIELALTDEGHSVVAFDNCSEAYATLEKGKIRSNPKLDYIPVAIVTGSIPTAEILPPKDTYQALVIKPFDLQELMDIVEKLIV